MADENEKTITVITAQNDEPKPQEEGVTPKVEEQEGIPQWAKELSLKMDKLLNSPKPEPKTAAQPLKPSGIPSPPPAPKATPEIPPPTKKNPIEKIVKFLF